MRLRARFSNLACSAGRSTRTTGTEARPSLRAASRRWCPPMTDLSSRRAMTGSTKPNLRMERVSDSSLGVGDASGVGGIGPQVVDRDVDDRELVFNLVHFTGPHRLAGDGRRSRTISRRSPAGMGASPNL